MLLRTGNLVSTTVLGFLLLACSNVALSTEGSAHDIGATTGAVQRWTQAQVGGHGASYTPMGLVSSADGKRQLVLASNLLWLSDDGGLTLLSPAPNRVFNSFTASSDLQTIVALDARNRLAVSVDGGTSWVSRGPDLNFQSVCASADGTKMAASDNSGHIYTSLNAGANWTQQLTADAPGWGALQCSADGSVVVAMRFNGTVNEPYYSINFGANWLPLPGTTAGAGWTQQPVKVQVSADGTRVLCVGSMKILVSSNFGATWSEVYSGLNVRTAWANTDFSRLFVLHVSGEQYWSANGGVMWNTVPPTPPTVAGDVVFINGSSTLFARGYNYFLTSTNNGMTWKEAYLGAGGRNWKTAATSSDGTTVVVASSPGYLYLSNDRGNHWVEQATLGSRTWSRVAVSDDGSRLVAIESNSPNIYLSSDAGATWVPNNLTGNPTTSYLWTGLALSSAGTTILATTKSGLGFVSSNSGASWMSYSVVGPQFNASNTNESTGGILSADGTKGFITSNQFFLFSFVVGNPTPETIWAVNGAANYRITASSDLKRLYACSTPYVISPEQSNGAIYSSWRAKALYNGGAEIWDRESSAGNRNWTGISTSGDGTRVVASALGGFVYQSVDAGLNWVVDPSTGLQTWTDVVESRDGTQAVALANGYNQVWIHR